MKTYWNKKNDLYHQDSVAFLGREAKAGRPFFTQAGAQGFVKAPLFRFQYYFSGFCGYYAARIASISSFAAL